MPQDAFTLSFIAKELNAALKGGRVNRITQPAKEEVIFSVYTDKGVKNLNVNANASLCRIGFLSGERENPKTAYNFCMLLRKHLLSAVVESAEIMGFDRVIKLTFSAKNEFFENCEKQLYAEIMGKYSNVILTENDVILGAMKTASLDENAKRLLYTGVKYSLPPKQDKLDFADEKALAAALENRGDADMKDFLFTHIKGLAPSTAEELAARLSESGGSAMALCREISAFLKGGFELRPCVYYPNEKPADFFAFKPRAFDGNFKFYDSLLAAQSEFYREKENFSNGDALKKKLVQAVKHRENKFLKRLAVIEGKERDCAGLEKDRLKGELIISNIYRLQAGADSCELENYYDESGEKIKIALDKNLTPQENAQKYFKRFNKQKKTLAAIAPQKREVCEELEYLKSVYSEIDRADSAELREIEKELVQTGMLSGGKTVQPGRKKTEKAPSGLLYETEGFKICVGRNNVQNDALTHSARGSDVWLHVKDFHSSHVIISAEGRKVPDSVIQKAAEICAYYSEARESGKTPVDYTLKKYVKKPSGAKPGFVVYTDNSTVYVSAKRHENLLRD